MQAINGCFALVCQTGATRRTTTVRASCCRGNLPLQGCFGGEQGCGRACGFPARVPDGSVASLACLPLAAAAKWLSSQPNGSPRCGPCREKEPASPTETSPTVGGSVRDRLRRRRCRRGVLVCAERERVAFEVMRRWQLPGPTGPTGPFQPQTGQSGHSEPFLATQKGSETHNKHCAH